MGQSSSRLRGSPVPTTESPQNAVAGASTDLQPEVRGVADASTSGSRRSSVRKSILNFVKPSNIRSRVSSITESPRSWRNSRRWSKAPHDSIPPLLSPSISSTSLTAGPSTAPSTPSDKGKQPEVSELFDEETQELDLQAPIERLPSPLPLPNPDTQPGMSNVLNSEVEDEANSIYISEALGPDLEHQTPVYEWEGVEPLPSPQPQSTLPAPQPQPAVSAPRQFPPPGTLVVVQGIVHTTDVTRTPPVLPEPAASTSNLRPISTIDGESRSRTRNRLSALLRPRSISSRPASTVASDSAHVTSSPEPDLDLEADEHARTGRVTPMINNPTESSPAPLVEPPTTENRIPSISSSSIDVLGTLLSVAAAATAASLLTGSSEPILSSGLAPPGSSPLPNSTSSTPSLLGHSGSAGHPFGPVPNVPLADISAAGRAERMRQAWGTIRERLGLRPSMPPPPLEPDNPDNMNAPNISSGTEPTTHAPASLPDTRELMLAEMARAFNIGLGLNGLSGGLGHGGGAPHHAEGDHNTSSTGNAEDPAGTATTPPAAAQLPPEGSFERFLVDLQIDLRTALTQAEETSVPAEQHPPGRAASAPDILDSGSNGGSSATLRPDAAHVERHEDTTGQEQHEVPSPEVDREPMPGLQDVSDTESEFDEDNDEDYDDDDFHSAGHTSNLDSNGTTRGPSLGAGRIDASGRINWWRLYRFPPIVSPRMDIVNSLQAIVPGTTPTADSSSSGTPSAAASSTPPTSPELPLPAASTTPSEAGSPESSPSTSERPTQAPTPSNSVVPVIVVGLQSVNSEWRPDMPSAGDDGIDFLGQPHTEGNPHGADDSMEDEDFDGFNGPQTEGNNNMEGLPRMRGRGRARGWQSRAANAIRNLRPGRRATGAGAQQPTASPGSRTFLIYVIGGYYPPDHSIVTGGPNNLDSFEALLELADLLGQVKPPTVSKDEIAKSGLEIIKASQLAQHEKDGKISSNCTDRCLICLDDYEPEVDIRVMTCRHAFHKACVDEWLQTGRNNCPACRSTGVATDIPMPIPH